jgi:hypothetical protein
MKPRHVLLGKDAYLEPKVTWDQHHHLHQKGERGDLPTKQVNPDIAGREGTRRSAYTMYVKCQRNTNPLTKSIMILHLLIALCGSIWTHFGTYCDLRLNFAYVSLAKIGLTQ